MKLLTLMLLALSLNAIKEAPENSSTTSQESDDRDTPVNSKICTDLFVVQPAKKQFPQREYQRYDDMDLSFLSEIELCALGRLDDVAAAKMPEQTIDNVKWAVFTSLNDQEINKLANSGPGLAIKEAILKDLANN